jgi:hypothetical protein
MLRVPCSLRRPAAARRLVRLLMVALAVVASAMPARAQNVTPEEPDPNVARVRFGPLWLNPAIDLANAGVDTNVFNDPTDRQPKSDFTMTLVPKTQLWLRFGRTWFAGDVDEQVVWYQKYTNQRSLNSTASLAWRIPVSRLIVEVGGRYTNTRERPGYEIDTRAQQTDTTVNGKVEIRALSKTYVGVDASRTEVDFASDQTYLDVNLHEALNRVVTTAGVVARQQVTPLTALSVEVVREQDRFAFDPERNADATNATLGVSFDPQALLKGTAKIGYERYQPLDPELPQYTGATASVDLSYVLLGTTRFGVQAQRQVQYSYDLTEPYYLQTGVTGSVAQQIFGPLDVLVRGGLQHLAYRDRLDASAPVENRLDTVTLYSVGLGYHVGQDLRVGVNYNFIQRDSPLPDHRYSGRVIGTSATYGF